MNDKVDWVNEHPSSVIGALLGRIAYHNNLWADSQLCVFSTEQTELAQQYICAERCRREVISVLERSSEHITLKHLIDLLKVSIVSNLPAAKATLRVLLSISEALSGRHNGHKRLANAELGCVEAANRVFTSLADEREAAAYQFAWDVADCLYWQLICATRRVIANPDGDISYPPVYRARDKALLTLVHECCTIRAWA